jgi:hypothetical protein
LPLVEHGKLHQVFNLAVKVPLSRVFWLSECLQKDRCCGDVLAHAVLLRELHAGVVDDVAVDSACALPRGTGGVSPL